MIDLVQEGAVRSAHDGSVNEQDISNKNFHRWGDDYIRAHLSDLWTEYEVRELDGAYSMADDGAKLGNPGEETIVVQWWSKKFGQGSWLPFTVFGR